MSRAFVRLILEHLAHFSGQYSIFGFYGLLEGERLTSLSLYTLHLVLVMRVSPIDWISQQYDEFGIGHNDRSSLGGVRMKQVVRASLPRDVCTGVWDLQRKIGTVPIFAFSEVKIEIMHLFKEG